MTHLKANNEPNRNNLPKCSDYQKDKPYYYHIRGFIFVFLVSQHGRDMQFLFYVSIILLNLIA